jgi:hypothetical protein
MGHIQTQQRLLEVDGWVLDKVYEYDGTFYYSIQHMHSRMGGVYRNIKQEAFYRCFICNERVPEAMDGMVRLLRWER